MKINSLFILQEIADESIIVPVGDAASKLHGVIRLNKTGAFLWKLMEQKDYSDCELVEEMCNQFGIGKERATDDVRKYIQQLVEYGCIE